MRNENITPFSRRKFISNSIKLAGLAAAASLPMSGFAFSNNLAGMTVQQVIDLIRKDGDIKAFDGTVDTIKAGSADTVVTGIVTTMFATIAIIEQAVKLGANFIIAHEPTFYNHQDNPDWVKGNAVVKQKQELLAKHNITVWRFHDGIHAMKPDLVEYGTVIKLGWTKYFTSGKYDVKVPPMSLQQLIAHLKKSLNIKHVRVIGDLKQQCTHIALLPGAPGGQRQVAFAETEKPDVLVVGELSEWETAEYMRDQHLLGGKMSLIVLGHQFSEDPGMVQLVTWLQPKLQGIRVTHIASGDPFEWM